MHNFALLLWYASINDVAFCLRFWLPLTYLSLECAEAMECNFILFFSKNINAMSRVCNGMLKIVYGHFASEFRHRLENNWIVGKKMKHHSRPIANYIVRSSYFLIHFVEVTFIDKRLEEKLVTFRKTSCKFRFQQLKTNINVLVSV